MRILPVLPLNDIRLIFGLGTFPQYMLCQMKAHFVCGALTDNMLSLHSRGYTSYKVSINSELECDCPYVHLCVSVWSAGTPPGWTLSA